MNGGTHFRAPMSTKLKIFTAIFIALMGVVLFTAPPPANFGVLAILGLTAAFSVRGYTVPVSYTHLTMPTILLV